MNLIFLVFCFWLFPYLNYCFEEYMRSMPLGIVFRSTYQQHKKSSLVLSHSQVQPSKHHQAYSPPRGQKVLYYMWLSSV